MSWCSSCYANSSPTGETIWNGEVRNAVFMSAILSETNTEKNIVLAICAKDPTLVRGSAEYSIWDLCVKDHPGKTQF